MEGPSYVPEDGLDPQLGPYKVGDIKTVYHPRLGKEPLIQSLQEYNTGETNLRTAPLSTDKPWRPYVTRCDFEFSELALSACLNKEHIEAFIKLIQTIASEMKVTVDYNGEPHDYPIWGRDLWDWVMDQLRDTRLTPHWVWDTVRLFRWNGVGWMRFRHEPWTADLLWDVQTELPEGGTPLGLIVYADKTKLSSFGSEKGYPVIARCAQLPVEIRNSDGIGGGAIVGWLPVVEEGAAEDGKRDYVDHKRIVWHEAFYKLCKKMDPLSKTGFQCDLPNLKKLFFPFVAMLVADYEEQCVMAMIRGGHHSLCNCPKCLAESKNLSLLEICAPLRTAARSQEVVGLAKNRNKTEGEELLKKFGLRGLANVFWKIGYSDPHKALSFDKLHAYAIGLFGDHLWPEIIKLVKLLGRLAMGMVDKQADEFPRWRGLAHFKQVVAINFNDGSKFEDLSKITPYIVHNVIAQIHGSEGYLLLCLLRKYLELDMYCSFAVQTDQNIAAIRAKLLEFSQSLKEYQSKTGPTGKNWNFPKAHSHQHVPEDIEAKGATRNFNTKPDEKMHGSVKKTYLRRSNKRDVASQILTADHDTAVARIIRANIEDYDELNNLDGSEEDADEDDIDQDSGPTPPQVQKSKAKSNLAFGDNLILGAPQKPTTIADFTASNEIYKDLLADLAALLKYMDYKTPEGNDIQVTPQDEVIEYRFLKVHYQSLETWKQSTDYLRCNPNFYGQERRDHVLMDVEDGELFGRLLFAFTFSVNGTRHPFVILKPLDGEITVNDRDKDLGFYRLRSGEHDAELFPAEHLVRGALITSDPGNHQEFFVVDHDPDMFCRLNALRSSRFGV
ncbi:uncharacterized protein B0H18DRAFT_1086042 [Fomitopsis serialis]|uniref:uncharacterized protein n=1 Tax=Fomitopsis serialis TaxID=139415 RepID=UPI00200742B2|nr:uncharacterized protein B0H18DRAFT_1086042 [Neoantrodia serialis]KAH9921770.1 hypothetical protein B0H18DRAFT_1086042 [Neoantrodia serialis]